MKFHEAYPVPDTSSNKRLKIQFDTHSSNRSFTSETTTTINNAPKRKIVSFYESENSISVEIITDSVYQAYLSVLCLY